MAVSASQALNLKIPPHSHEAESAVLGTLMTDNSAWEKIGDLISPEDFYKPEHKLIYQNIVSLIERSKVADVVTVLKQ